MAISVAACGNTMARLRVPPHEVKHTAAGQQQAAPHAYSAQQDTAQSAATWGRLISQSSPCEGLSWGLVW